MSEYDLGWDDDLPDDAACCVCLGQADYFFACAACGQLVCDDHALPVSMGGDYACCACYLRRAGSFPTWMEPARVAALTEAARAASVRVGVRG